jgi:hypothetical protein
MANFLRTLAQPEAVKQWSLTMLVSGWCRSVPR